MDSVVSATRCPCGKPATYKRPSGGLAAGGGHELCWRCFQKQRDADVALALARRTHQRLDRRPFDDVLDDLLRRSR
jgi:hypothetical protein